MKILSNKKQINNRVYEEIKIRADVTENMFKVFFLIFAKTKQNANSCSFVDCFLYSSPFTGTISYSDNKQDTFLDISKKGSFII